MGSAMRIQVEPCRPACPGDRVQLRARAPGVVMWISSPAGPTTVAVCGGTGGAYAAAGRYIVLGHGLELDRETDAPIAIPRRSVADAVISMAVQRSFPIDCAVRVLGDFANFVPGTGPSWRGCRARPCSSWRALGAHLSDGFPCRRCSKPAGYSYRFRLPAPCSPSSVVGFLGRIIADLHRLGRRVLDDVHGERDRVAGRETGIGPIPEAHRRVRRVRRVVGERELGLAAGRIEEPIDPRVGRDALDVAPVGLAVLQPVHPLRMFAEPRDLGGDRA